MVACAGHVERVPRAGGLGPNALPLACFASDGRRLSAEEFVVGFTRVFVFESRRNALPMLDGVKFDGAPVDPMRGIVTGHCVPDNNDQCKTVELDTLFRDEIAEIDPDNLDANGNVGRETLYVDWFTTVGEIAGNRSIVFDPYRGHPSKTTIDFDPPRAPAKGTLSSMSAATSGEPLIFTNSFSGASSAGSRSSSGEGHAG